MDVTPSAQAPQPPSAPQVPPVSSLSTTAANGGVPAQAPAAGTAAVDSAALTSIAQSPQTTPISSAKSKETGPLSSEVAGFVEVAGTDAFELEPLPVEVASFMEKVSRGENGGAISDVTIPAKVQGQQQSASSSAPKYVVPLGKSEFNRGLHQDVNSSIRWLAEWCKRMLHKLGPEATYQS